MSVCEKFLPADFDAARKGEKSDKITALLDHVKVCRACEEYYSQTINLHSFSATGIELDTITRGIFRD